MNNAALNGEAEECPKTAAASDTPFPDEITGDTFVDESSLFRGAIVFDGEGVMLVKKVGIKTMMGRMALEMQEEEPPSPLQVKLSILAGQISKIGYIGAILIALFYVIHFVSMAGGVEPYLNMGWEYILMDLIDAVTIAIVIIVCAVPEGLPLMISITKIGEELSAAALTRGLGTPARRTNICKVGFGWLDMVLFLFSILCWIGFLFQ